MDPQELITRYKQLKKHKRLSRGNSKLAACVGIFNLPAVHSCLNCKDCLDSCYARQAQIQYPNVREFRNANYHLAKVSPEVLTELLLAQIDSEKIRIVRIHESGDFFSADYLKLWYNIAIQRPHVMFYSYTKVIHLFEGEFELLNTLPNVNIINSFIDGHRNYGSGEYVASLINTYGCFLCPGEGCMSACTHCLTKDNVVFQIHGTLKTKDTYKEKIYENV